METVCQFLKAFVTATLPPRTLTTLHFFLSAVYKRNCFFLEGSQLNVLRAFSLKIKDKRDKKDSAKLKPRSVVNYSDITSFTGLPSVMYFVILGECLQYQFASCFYSVSWQHCDLSNFC